MPSDELIELLQRTVARELQVVIQYMWQHVRATGMKSPAIADELKKIAIEEMKHAETAAERLDYFEVEATTIPTPITIGTTLREMIELDKAAEEEAIALYKLAIKKATDENDYVTRLMYMEILKDEEEHDHLFKKLLEED